MKYLGEAALIIGIKIYRDRSRRLIGLCQSAYMDKILKRYRMDNSKRDYISMQERLDLNKTQGASTPEEVKRMQNVPYASAVGSIINPEAELRVDCYCNAGFETGKIGKVDVLVLIDNGGTHNFIRPDVVEKMCLPIKAKKAFKGVTEVDLYIFPMQGPDVVLGIQWLQNLGKVTHDYAHQTMKFTLLDFTYSLKGDDSLRMKKISLHKMQVMLEHDDVYGVYEVPTTLPPHRLIDHCINLLPETKPVNEHQFYVKKTKCVFGAETLEYLGHMISGREVEMDPKKVIAVRAWPEPMTQRQVRGFLGLARYYRRFIKGYATMAASLTELLRKDGFRWGGQEAAAFWELKQQLSITPILSLLDFTQEFVVDTDASDYGIWAVLLQHNRAISYFSRKLGPRMCATTTYQKELFAIVEAVNKWRQYLVERRLKIRTNHKSIKIHTPIQQKYVWNLMGFDFVVEYKPGVANQVADALSRMYEDGELVKAKFIAISQPIVGLLDYLKCKNKTLKELQPPRLRLTIPMGVSSSQPQSSQPRSPINAFSIEELYTLEYSKSLQENTGYLQQPGPYEATTQTSRTKKKKKATRNRQMRQPMMYPDRLRGQLKKKLRWLKVKNLFLKTASGNPRKKDGFWVEVMEYIESNTNMEDRRTYDMVVGKWKMVRPAVVRFCVVYSKVMRMAQKSGVIDEDYVQKAMVQYQAETGLHFKFRHCWDVLKDILKFQDIAFPNLNQGSQGSSKRHKSSGGRDKAIAAAKNKGSKVLGSLTINDDALARLVVNEMTTVEVEQREAFINLKRREVECREREIAATEYRAQQEDMKLYLKPYDHFTESTIGMG
nr:transposon Ty3-G Gag-Pol polyprotein [Tanacetum cinerariifolium]